MGLAGRDVILLKEIYNIGEILGRTAATSPEREALRCRGQSRTYRELDLQANRIAQTLLASGLQRGARVALLGLKSLDMIAAMQGVLRADGVYVPLDPRSPVARIASVCSDCQVNVAILDAGACGHAPELARAGVGIFLDLDDSMPAGVGHAIRRAEVDHAQATPHRFKRGHDDLAYILYTSGSTGQPKGVMLSHKNALTVIRWSARHFAFDSADRILNHTPLTFDLPVCDLYNGFLAGATVVLLPEADALFPAATVRTIRDERITSILAVPSSYVSLMNRGGLLALDPAPIRRLLYSGEAFPVQQLRQLRAWAPNQHICNLYGPIETNYCTHYCVHEIALEADSVPIGKEIDDVRIGIYNEEGQKACDGEEGEICVAGGSVTLGYWGDEARSRARRILLDGEIHFLTGDRGFRDKHGDLHFLGRRDTMVKSRGYRIELAEIEHVIGTHPGVIEVAVVAAPDLELGSLLYAWFVPASASITSTQVAEHASKLLPNYMLPRMIFPLDQLPKTDSGKISRRRLAEMLAVKSAEIGERAHVDH